MTARQIIEDGLCRSIGPLDGMDPLLRKHMKRLAIALMRIQPGRRTRPDRRYQ